jgi:hypothetical protein
MAAYREAGEGEVPCDVRQGTQRDAVLHSVGANSAHGVRRTNADKRRAAETLLRDEEWSKWSDREIARRACVSQPFVSKLRASDNRCQMGAGELRPEGEEPRRATRNGRPHAVRTGGINQNRRKARASKRSTPEEEVEHLDAVLTAATEAAQRWKDLTLDWEGHKRFDMLFARERAAALTEMLNQVSEMLRALREDCRAGGAAAT